MAILVTFFSSNNPTKNISNSPNHVILPFTRLRNSPNLVILLLAKLVNSPNPVILDYVILPRIIVLTLPSPHPIPPGLPVLRYLARHLNIIFFVILGNYIFTVKCSKRWELGLDHLRKDTLDALW